MAVLKPIKIPSAKERVASELRKAILSKQIEEGENLSLESVAQQLNVSITPVREAFQILSRDGLIKLRPNKGAIVLGITETYIREHYQLRGILESACAGIAASPDTDIHKIEQSYLGAKKMIESGDYSQYANCNREFHSEIWATSGNKKMENMIAELWNGLSMGSMVTEEEYANISIKEHKAIYEARKAHDVQLAQQKMYEHIMRSCDDMLTYYV